MKFGWTTTREAAGALSAHSLKRGGCAIKKGQRLESADIEALLQEGVDEILVARLEPGDVSENEAARRIAQALAGSGLRCGAPTAGRVNLYAEAAGLIRIDPARIDGANAVSEDIGVATLAPWREIAAGEMAATVKIIPYATPERNVEEAIAAGAGAIALAPYRPLAAALIVAVAETAQGEASDKIRRALAARLKPAGAAIAHEARVAHAVEALADAIPRAAAASDLVVIFGGAATSDRRDAVPAAIEKAGGSIAHFGMPVDPGNLLLLGASREGVPIIGAPTCARSVKENGFDFVLRRILCGLPPTSADIRKMGVGGLLKEIATRPQPRDGAAEEFKTHDLERHDG